LTEKEIAVPLETARVTSDYFDLFGAKTVLGRTFSPADDRPEARRVAVISEALWRSRFQSSPRLVGDTISLDGEPSQVIGVLAPLVTEKPIDIWLPMHPRASLTDHISRVHVAGRLRPGIVPESAIESVKQSQQWFRRRYPRAPLLYGEEFTAVPLRDAIVGDVRSALRLLTGGVGFVLLIACTNVGSLVLARASRRTAEIAVRAALGARRQQLIRQLLAESILVALSSGIVGLVLGFAGVRGLLWLSPADLPRVGANGSALSLDGRIFLFTFLVSISSGVLFGLLPAILASKANLMALVKDTTTESGMGFRRNRARPALVISQVMLTLVLLVGAGLLTRTFVATRSSDRGFREQGVLTAEMSLNGAQFQRAADVAGLVENVEKRLKQISGVAAVATTSALPLERALMMPFTITRHDQSLVGRYHGTAAWRSVSADYFKALRIRLLFGRSFSNEDSGQAAGVVLINRTMMRKFWQDVNANPVGEFLIIGQGVSPEWEDTPRQVIGVVDDIREAGLDREPMMYVPVAQVPDALTARNSRLRPVTWVVRTTDSHDLQGAIEHGLQEGTGLPLGRVRTMREVVAASSARAQFYALVLTVFSGVALLLSAVGLYNILSYSVHQRTREIGVRLALGAEPQNIRWMVMWHGMRLALLGITMGIGAALALTRVMESMVYGVKPWDPAVFAVVTSLLAAVAAIAAYWPSVRATKVNPCESLRV
jgi:predicted permease